MENTYLSVSHYRNRKYYVHETKTYVTISQMAELISRGFKLTIRKHPEMIDITSKTLTSVLTALQKRDLLSLTPDSLHARIKLMGKRIEEIAADAS